jgi:hypothetical protein
MSLRQKYVDILTALGAIGAVSGSLLYGPGALATAGDDSAQTSRSASATEPVSERLDALRQAISAIAGAGGVAVEGQTSASTPPYRLAWGNTNVQPGMPWPNAVMPGFQGSGGGSTYNRFNPGLGAPNPYNNWNNVAYPQGYGPNTQLDSTDSTQCHFINSNSRACSNGNSEQCQRVMAFLRSCVANGAIGPHGE